MSIKKSLPLVGSIFTVLLFSVFVFNGCESSRVGPEIARPNPPAPVAQPIILSAYVRDISNNSAIAGATVKITKADNTLVTTMLTDNSGHYSYDVTSSTETTLLVNANKDGYGFSSRVAEINKSVNIAIVDDILLAKLQVVSAPVTPAAGGTASTPSTQTVASTPLTVTVPPNAVPANITLTIAPIIASQLPAPPTATNSIQTAAQFGPSGTVFAVPVTVKFPLPNKQAVGKTFNLLKLNETTNVWASTGIIATVDATGTVATAQLSSFSTWAADDPLTITISLTGTTASEDIGKVTLASGATFRQYPITNSISISVTGTVDKGWLKGEVNSNSGNINEGTFYQNLNFAFPGLPSNYINNGVQYNPANPNQAGNWVFEWVVKRVTTTRNWTASGGAAPNTFTGSGSIITQTIDVAGSWVWISHDQGGTNWGG